MFRLHTPGVIVVALLAGASLFGADRPVRPSWDEQYVLGPDSQPQQGVPQGKIMEFTLADSKTYPGFTRQWWLYIPPGYDGKTPLPVMVFQDGGGYVRRGRRVAGAGRDREPDAQETAADDGGDFRESRRQAARPG